MGALTGDVRSLSVNASEASVLLEISSIDFEYLCQNNSKLIQSIFLQLIKRSQGVLEMIAEEKYHPYTVLLPVDNSVSCDTLINKMSINCKQLKFNSQIIHNHPDEDITIKDKNQHHIFAFSQLNDALFNKQFPPGGHFYLICEAQSKPHIDPKLIDKMQELLKIQPCSIHLIILHKESTVLPENTIKWLSLLKFTQHHHVKPNLDKHIHRLIRFIHKKPLGVVLSGGGVKGLAHIGAIKGLQESKLPIDYIGGTSIGGLSQHVYQSMTIVINFMISPTNSLLD